MPAANVPMDIDQGEDFASQIIWTDNLDDPLPVIHPARMDIKSNTGAIIYTLESDPNTPIGSIAGITLSETTGLLQLYIPKSATAAMTPGTYIYDLFVTISDGGSYAGSQAQRLLVGPVTVNKRVTQMA